MAALPHLVDIRMCVCIQTHCTGVVSFVFLLLAFMHQYPLEHMTYAYVRLNVLLILWWEGRDVTFGPACGGVFHAV